MTVSEVMIIKATTTATTPPIMAEVLSWPAAGDNFYEPV
ncbi:hypothetical protein GBAR_LOCUS12805 [Geodia barretti]|uniref:Uncharacterized protein n=1 Tax=Geodia barretti TaxID=519541 RepID=A0AA35S2A3_GEOBA|nr:hypothetical protein GBAR_LOCUS12805 [Geodia barretti]